MCSELKVGNCCFISLKTDHVSLTLVQTKNKARIGYRYQSVNNAMFCISMYS